MGVNTTTPIVVYGYTNPQQAMSPQPIVSVRDPQDNDLSELGTLWVNKTSNAYWICTSITAGVANWQAQQTGTGTFTDVTVTGGSGTVLTVDAGGNTDLGGDLAVAGDSVLAGDLTVDGTTTINGDFVLVSADAISLESTFNGTGAIELTADGGTSESIEIVSLQGTGDAINLAANDGDITIKAPGSTHNDAIDIEAAAGGFSIDSVKQSNITVTGSGQDLLIQGVGGSIAISSTEAVSTAVSITASDAAGKVAISGVGGVTIASTDATIAVTSGVGAINIGADAFAHTVTVGNISGATAVNVNTGTGGFHVVSTGAGDITAASSDTLLLDSAGVLELNSSAGVIGIGNDAVAQAINIGTGAAARTITIGNVTTTTGLVLNSGTGGVAVASTTTGDITLNSADTVLIDAAGVLELNSSAGVIGIGNDAVAQNINIGTGAAARVITVGNISAATAVHVNSGTGGVALVSTGTGDITAASGDTMLLDAVGVLEINSSAGVIGIGNDAVAQDINLGTGAAARIITVGNISGATAVNVNSGTGGFNVVSTGSGDVTMNSADTMLLDAAGILELNSSAGIISIGNDAVAQNINIGTGAAARVITVGNISSSTALHLNSGTGGIVMASTGSGDITAASSDTLLLDAAGVLELNSSAGAISVGNDAVSQAINIGTAGSRTMLVGNATAGTTLKLNTPANIGVTLQNDLRIITGAGSPNGAVTAPAGSLWLRTDPAGATSRIYVNTDSGTTWTNVTCAA